MAYKLEIQKEARFDLERAYDWYEEQRVGLGYEFIEEVESGFNSIAEFPERYGFVRGSLIFRRFRVSRFPYMIVYEVEGDVITVISISHFKQNRKF